MKKFIKKVFLFALPILITLAIPIGTFYALDPFKIIKEYDSYTNSIVAYNEDYIATERFLKHKTKYNSFIFGSSRAGCGFQPTDWEKELNNADRAFSFTASEESIFGILGKVRLLDKENTPINNVLLVIDADITMRKTVNSKGHLFIKHPLISGESKNAFTSEHLKDYIFTGFFVRYLDYRLFNKRRNYMKGYLDFSGQDPTEPYIPFNVEKREGNIKSDSTAYYRKKADIFYKRSPKETYHTPLIQSKHMEMLSELKDLFLKHNTSYKIIISPLYDQKRINTADLDSIQKIFKEDNVFDFSGKNSFTNSKYNYYESSHYRVTVGRQIIKTIYP